MAGDRERCLAAGMDDHLAKPLQRAALAEMLDRWVAAESVRGPDGEPVAPLSPQVGVGEGAPSRGGDRGVPLDLGRLAEITGDDEGFARELVNLFIEDATTHLATLTEAIEQGEAAVVGEIAHTLKGSASNVGAEPIRGLAYEMEQCGRNREFSGVESLLAAMRGELERVREAAEEGVR